MQNHSQSRAAHGDLAFRLLKKYLEVHELLCVVAFLQAGGTEECSKAGEAYIVAVEVVGHCMVLVGHRVLVTAQQRSP